MIFPNHKYSYYEKDLEEKVLHSSVITKSK